MWTKVWVFLFVVVTLFLFSIDESHAQFRTSPSVEGWTVGLAFSDVYGTQRFGGQIGYWGAYVGFEAGLMSTALLLSFEDDFDALDTEDSLGLFHVGLKIGSQISRAKWFGRVGVGSAVQEQKVEADLFLAESELSVLFFEIGLGVDFAVTDNLVLGLRMFDLRIYEGEYTEDDFDLDLSGVQASFLGGGHISFQF